MKIIKYTEFIKESTDNFLEELKQFCNDNIAYLLDEEFKINFLRASDNQTIMMFSKGETDPYYGNLREYKPEYIIEWNDIKDDFIPFIELLDERYKITKVRIQQNNKFKMLHPLDKQDNTFIKDLKDAIINDQIESTQFYIVFIYIKNSVEQEKKLPWYKRFLK